MTTKTAREAAAKDSAAAQDNLDEPAQITFTVEINGKEIELTCVEDLMESTPDVYLAYENNSFGKMFEALLGPSQLYTVNRAGMKTRDIFETLLPAWSEANSMGE